MIDQYVKAALAILAVLGFFLIAVLSHFIVIPEGNPVEIIIGNAATLAGLVLGYYFGSSKGASEQREITKQALDKVGTGSGV